MMVVKKLIEDRLSVDIVSMSPLSGGDINDVYMMDSSAGRFIVKSNYRDMFPNMLEREAKGLKQLGKSGVTTPEVIDHFEHDELQVLILQYFEQKRANKEFWMYFAQDLSNLHQSSHAFFGLEYDNYIGSLQQANQFKSSWEEFFIENRLKPLIKKAFDNKLLNDNHLNSFEGFFKVFSELIPIEPPSLLHGDLWSGNLLCSAGQKPVFIDPAVYFGHREADLAMTQMFGGFDSAYLNLYNDCLPLEEGWQNRISIHNLYPNLVHLILFGRSYLSGIENVIKRFTRKN